MTPVRDEVQTIGRTIAAVARQTCPPSEWVIVSDGSTDGTDELVQEAARRYAWITLVALPARPDRRFDAVVRNTEAGVRALQGGDYDYLGLLDADVEFQCDYFERLIAHFAAKPRLGLAGGVVIDPGMRRDRLPRNRQDVPGAVQFFRRACFDRLGGLVAIPEGGWDCLTCAMARMHGFETELVVDLVVDHLKPRNVSHGGVVARHLQLGARDYAIGYDPLFELVKCLGRAGAEPRLVGGLAQWCGFCGSMVRRPRRLVPTEVVRFVRTEQRRRLRTLFPSWAWRRRVALQDGVDGRPA